MKNILLCILALALFSACGSRKFSKNNKKIEKNAKRTGDSDVNHTALSYINLYKDVAISQMKNNGIPASIILAQGLLESGNGNSSLAKYANNHFGIKCTSDWTGKVYYKDDDQKNDCFRVYKNAQESFKDHSVFLKRKRYSALFELDRNDYKNWAIGLKQAGYATNPKYPELLTGIIEKYKLYQFDSPESETEKFNRENRVFAEINKNIPLENKKFNPTNGPQNNNNNIIHEVGKGDTLFSISKKYNLTVEELKQLNNLVGNDIKIGQKLKVVK